MADDGDPLDVLVVIAEPTFPGCVVRCRPIGVLDMADEKGHDFKILAVAADDPRWDAMFRLADLSPHRLLEIETFFRTYKTLERRPTDVRGWLDVEDAWAIIDAAHGRRGAGRPTSHPEPGGETGRGRRPRPRPATPALRDHGVGARPRRHAERAARLGAAPCRPRRGDGRQPGPEPRVPRRADRRARRPVEPSVPVPPGVRVRRTHGRGSRTAGAGRRLHRARAAGRAGDRRGGGHRGDGRSRTRGGDGARLGRGGRDRSLLARAFGRHGRRAAQPTPPTDPSDAQSLRAPPDGRRAGRGRRCRGDVPIPRRRRGPPPAVSIRRRPGPLPSGDRCGARGSPPAMGRRG